MTFYDGRKKIHHWFPRVNRMTEDYTDYDDTPDTMIVNDTVYKFYKNTINPQFIGKTACL